MWDITVSPVTGINESNEIQAGWNGTMAWPGGIARESALTVAMRADFWIEGIYSAFFFSIALDLPSERTIGRVWAGLF